MLDILQDLVSNGEGGPPTDEEGEDAAQGGVALINIAKYIYFYVSTVTTSYIIALTLHLHLGSTERIPTYENNYWFIFTI